MQMGPVIGGRYRWPLPGTMAVEQVHHRADALGQVAFELGQLLAGAEQLVGDVERGQRQRLDRVLAAELAFHALDALLDVGRERRGRTWGRPRS